MNRKSIGIVLFTLQMLLIVLLAIFGEILPEAFYMKLLSFLGYVLILWAFYQKKFKVHPLPNSTENMELITDGPFKFVRHPIYLGLLLVTYSWLPPYLSSFTFIFLYPIFLGIIVVKIMFEEKELYQKFPQYYDYAKKTKRLIPFIY